MRHTNTRTKKKAATTDHPNHTVALDLITNHDHRRPPNIGAREMEHAHEHMPGMK